VIDWSTTDWSGLEAAVNGTFYVVHVAARRTADTKDRYFRPASPITLTLKAAPGTSAVSPGSVPITVTAASVTVADTGLGFGMAATAGTGVGLANIRERLQLLYGPKAALTVAMAGRAEASGLLLIAISTP
jgi:hypothetical protein